MDPLLQNIVVLLMASFPIYMYAYPNGQVTSSCVTMTPEHTASTQTSSSPYTLILDKYTYSSGDKIKVTLSSSSATQFRGFLIQARSGSSTIPVGSFVTSNSNTQALTCTSAASSVSQTSNVGKTSIDVTWVAPVSNIADIQLRATVVQTEKVFWTNVMSAKITYVPTTNTSSTTVGNPSTTSTTVGNPSNTSTTVGNPSTTSTTVGNPSNTSTTVGNPSTTNKTATTTSSNIQAPTSGVQHTRTFEGLLLTCGVLFAFLG